MSYRPPPRSSRCTPPGVLKGDRVSTAQVGFTMIELLTVMAVAGILMLIAAPRIDVPRFQLDAAMREIGSSVALARGRSILRQHDYILMFHENGFVLLEDRNNNGSTDPGEERRTVELPDRVRFDRGGATPMLGLTQAISFTKTAEELPALTFHRNGAASEEGVIYLTSVRAAGAEVNSQDTRALRIERATGRVRCFTYRTLSWREGC